MLNRIVAPVKCRARQWHSGAGEDRAIGLRAATVAAFWSARWRAWLHRGELPHNFHRHAHWPPGYLADYPPLSRKQKCNWDGALRGLARSKPAPRWALLV